MVTSGQQTWYVDPKTNAGLKHGTRTPCTPARMPVVQSIDGSWIELTDPPRKIDVPGVLDIDLLTSAESLEVETVLTQQELEDWEAHLNWPTAARSIHSGDLVEKCLQTGCVGPRHLGFDPAQMSIQEILEHGEEEVLKYSPYAIYQEVWTKVRHLYDLANLVIALSVTICFGVVTCRTRILEALNRLWNRVLLDVKKKPRREVTFAPPQTSKRFRRLSTLHGDVGKEDITWL